MASTSAENSHTRRRVTYRQLEILWEFLNSNKDVAVGFNKSAQAREYAKRMWEEVAEALNSLGEGAFKDWKGWSNYWVDYKAKLKRRVAAVRLSQNRTGGGPSNVPPLDALEQKFLSILGAGFGSGLSNVQVDPFPNIPSTSGTALRSEPLNSDSDAVMIEFTASESVSRGDIHIATIDTQNTGTEELPHPQVQLEVPTEAPPRPVSPDTT